MNDPLISVILPTFNRNELLPRAIKSVLAQTYPDWELIVWDDGSTDDTAKTVQSFGDPRIRYFSSANHGVAYARNRASEVSTGALLAFLDSDDEWVNKKLVDQMQVLSKYPDIDLLFGDFLNFNSASDEKYRAFGQYVSTMRSLSTLQLQDRLFLIQSGMLAALARENFIATDTVIVRRDVFKRLGGFMEELRNGEDFELWWRMGLAGVRFAYVDDVFLTRYKLPENLSGASIPACESTLRALDSCLRQSVSQGKGDLIPSLNAAYRNVWQNMITLHGERGEGKRMWQAFAMSIRYGLSLGSFRLLAEAFIRKG